MHYFPTCSGWPILLITMYELPRSRPVQIEQAVRSGLWPKNTNSTSWMNKPRKPIIAAPACPNVVRLRRSHSILTHLPIPSLRDVRRLKSLKGVACSCLLINDSECSTGLRRLRDKTWIDLTHQGQWMTGVVVTRRNKG